MFEDTNPAPVVLLPAGQVNLGTNTAHENIEGSAARNRFREFFRNFRLGNVYIYRDALIRHWNRREYWVQVDLMHVSEYDTELFNSLQSRPNDILPYFEAGAKDALNLFLQARNASEANEALFQDFQVILKSSQLPQSIRSLTSIHVNKLVKVPGIVISTSKAQSRPTFLTVRCKTCKHDKVLRDPHRTSVGGIPLPQKCDVDKNPTGDGVEGCGKDPYIIMPDDCEFFDQQLMKLQESPEVVPTGEMPRAIRIQVERRLVDMVTPGTRVSVMGVLSMSQRGSSSKYASAIAGGSRPLFLRVVGIEIDNTGTGRLSTNFTPAEEEAMQALARDPDIYEKLARSIAPQISGDYTKDLKKAIACLLMSGSRKTLPDGVKLRGDINVLLIGDPSTAKSQFLKFVERAAPIGVYTSGKGSSAAGLTASVIKDAKGEYFLEGGAMVLADGGVICIDEFDKMRSSDRVAIHEAMEQQTISIAKAGITTVLNSRASVLAAANPKFGRYDDLQDVGENIDLMTTILSRFDLIFVVRDVREPERDKGIARHVLGVHMNAAMSEPGMEPEIDLATLKKFVNYCRERCAPRLNDEAAAMLSSQYVHIRNRVRESLQSAGSDGAQVVPITVRQLEALIRISESLAKMRLSAEATVADVEEALRLFRVSTLAAGEANPQMFGDASSSQEITRVSEFLRRRMGLKVTVNARKVTEEALAYGFPEESVKRTLAVMVQRNEVQELHQKKILKRMR